MFLAGHMLKRDVVVPMETADSIIDVDTNHNDPQLCATLACDIYKHLRMAEVIAPPLPSRALFILCKCSFSPNIVFFILICCAICVFDHDLPIMV